MTVNLLPQLLIDSLEGVPGFDREQFLDVHTSAAQLTSIRLNPYKPLPLTSGLPTAGHAPDPVPWTRLGHYLSDRPSFTFDPLFHAGCYYVQEASSMFLEQAFVQLTDLSKPIKVLDLSAAPGGKSTHIQSLIHPGGFLVSNDVIRSRAAILKDNIIKWGSSNVMVTSNDPRDFSKLPELFDVIVVDAPCSGSGLFRRDPEAITEWSINNVQLCAQRQQRILADIWPALKPGGLLIYSTCSYSREEDEAIVEWITSQLDPNWCELNIDPSWGITVTQTGHAKAYRFWPYALRGEGFFMTCLRKNAGDEPRIQKSKQVPDRLNKRELDIVKPWIQDNDFVFIRNENTVYAWPSLQHPDWSLLLERMRVVYSGTLLGELVRDKLVPDHPLALSTHVNPDINKLHLRFDDAILYLQRKELHVHTDNLGWQLVTYEDRAIGWVNVLPNRINNYYPKELRILKEAR